MANFIVQLYYVFRSCVSCHIQKDSEVSRIHVTRIRGLRATICECGLVGYLTLSAVAEHDGAAINRMRTTAVIIVLPPTSKPETKGLDCARKCPQTVVIADM
jgi:hypothetical protein